MRAFCLVAHAQNLTKPIIYMSKASLRSSTLLAAASPGFGCDGDGKYSHGI